MRQTGNVFEVVYKGVVYDLHTVRTSKKPKLTRAKRNKGQVVQQLTVTACPNCGEVMVDGICMANCQRPQVPIN